MPAEAEAKAENHQKELAAKAENHPKERSGRKGRKSAPKENLLKKKIRQRSTQTLSQLKYIKYRKLYL